MGSAWAERFSEEASRLFGWKGKTNLSKVRDWERRKRESEERQKEERGESKSAGRNWSKVRLGLGSGSR